MKRSSKNSRQGPHPTREPPSLAAQAQHHAAAAIAILVKIVQHADNHTARLAAINTLLDRGFGKPPRSLSIAIKAREPIMSEEEKAQATADYAALVEELYERP